MPSWQGAARVRAAAVLESPVACKKRSSDRAHVSPQLLRTTRGAELCPHTFLKFWTRANHRPFPRPNGGVNKCEQLG